MRRVALLVLANLACATTPKAIDERWPDALGASQLLQEHWNAPAKSNAQFERNTAVIGLALRRLDVPGRGPAVDLQTHERGYFVRCWLTAAAAAIQISADQLVALRGVGVGMNKDAPELRDCTVTWLGDPPGPRPVDSARNAAAVAASQNLCLAEMMVQALEHEKDPESEYFAKRRADMARRTQRNRDLLATLKRPALPCDHPLSLLVSRCKALELGYYVSSPVLAGERVSPSEGASHAQAECGAPEVKEVLALMTLEDG